MCWFCLADHWCLYALRNFFQGAHSRHFVHPSVLPKHFLLLYNFGASGGILLIVYRFMYLTKNVCPNNNQVLTPKVKVKVTQRVQRLVGEIPFRLTSLSEWKDLDILRICVFDQCCVSQQQKVPPPRTRSFHRFKGQQVNFPSTLYLLNQ